MHVISRKRLREFWSNNPNAKSPLSDWFRVVRRASWRNLADIRTVYPHADAGGECTVFNIKGNDYRLITKIFYRHQTVLVRFVLTHKEYDKEKWKDDCNC